MKWPSNPVTTNRQKMKTESLGGSLKDCIRAKVNIDFEIL